MPDAEGVVAVCPECGQQHPTVDQRNADEWLVRHVEDHRADEQGRTTSCRCPHPRNFVATCDHCGGAGTVQVAGYRVPCSVCDGKGKRLTNRCDHA